MRIKEAVVEGRRGSEWCIRETIIGQMYLESCAKTEHCRETGRSLKLLFPETKSALETNTPPAAIAPSVLLGIVPNPDLHIRRTEGESEASMVQKKKGKKKSRVGAINSTL